VWCVAVVGVCWLGRANWNSTTHPHPPLAHRRQPPRGPPLTHLASLGLVPFERLAAPEPPAAVPRGRQRVRGVVKQTAPSAAAVALSCAGGVARHCSASTTHTHAADVNGGRHRSSSSVRHRAARRYSCYRRRCAWHGAVQHPPKVAAPDAE